MIHKEYITLVSGRCGVSEDDPQAKMLIKRIEVDTSGRSSCCLCNDSIVSGSLRLVVKNGRYDYRAHLNCWKLDPIIEPTIFPGYQNLGAKKRLVEEYCDKVNGSILKKRKAEDELPNERSSKRICLESALDEKIWDYVDQCQIKWLPTEIFDIIFSRLDVKSLMRLSLTCKKIFVLGTAEEKWQQQVESKWPHLLHLKVDSGQLWLSFYRILRDYTCIHCSKPTPHDFPPVNGKLCETCRGLAQYQTIPKKWAKSSPYNLTDADIKKANLQFFKSNTCHGYLETKVRDLAKSLGKHGKKEKAKK